MQVTIIGSGNVATVMGRVLVKNGACQVHQVFSRDIQHATELAAVLGAEAVDDLSALDDCADLYLIAVTDDALPEIAAGLSLTNKLVIHTAGSISGEVLKHVSTRYGVLWPMKMIRKQMQSLEPVTLVVNGSSQEVIQEIRSFAAQFSTVIVQADDTARAKMHMLATLTSNFANHLYDLAAAYCAAEQIDFSVFYPIIRETANSLNSAAPAEQQAGPAFRGDWVTMEKHISLLKAYPDIARIYTMMSESIGKRFGKENKSLIG